MRRLPYALFLLPATVLLLATSSPDAVAQGATWTEESSFEIPALGRLGRMLTNKPVESTVFMSPTAYYSEQDDQAQVVNLDTGTFLFIDHKKEQYSEMTFEEMMARFDQAVADIQAEREDVSREAAESDAEVDYEFQFDADATGESKKIDGHEADQLLMTMKVLYTAEQTDEDGNTETAKGNFFVLVDSWRSDEAISGVEEEFMTNYAERMGDAFAGMQSGDGMASLQQAFEQDPRIGPAMQRLQEEQAKTPGVQLEGKTYFVLAPEDQEELDVDAILDPPKKKRGRGLGRLARAAAGIPGASGNDDNDDEAGPSEQTVLFVVTTKRDDFDAWTVDAQRFTAPDGYTKVDMMSGE